MKKKLILMLMPVLMGLGACNKITTEEAAESVIDGSRERVPLLVQQLVYVDNITIDSMHLAVKTEPMSGYLYTTWTAGEKSTPIIVEVTDIKESKTNKGYIEWQADWESAARAFFKNSMLGELMSLPL